MNPNVFSTRVFFARHMPSGQVRRVSAVRQMSDGSLLYQFAQVIKFNGDTIYHADSRECWS